MLYFNEEIVTTLLLLNYADTTCLAAKTLIRLLALVTTVFRALALELGFGLFEENSCYAVWLLLLFAILIFRVW